MMQSLNDKAKEFCDTLSGEVISSASCVDGSSFSFDDFFSNLASSGILAIIIAFIGWFFIYCNSRVLQKRSETWSVVKNISDLLQDIESQAKAFWLSSEKPVNAVLYEAEINSKLTELERWLKFLCVRVKKGSDHERFYKSQVVEIFKDSTLDTEHKDTMLEPQRLRKIVLLQKHTQNMKKLVDDDYSDTFL